MYRTDEAGASCHTLAGVPWQLAGWPRFAGSEADPVVYQPVLLGGTPLGSGEVVGLARITGVRSGRVIDTLVTGSGLGSIGTFSLGAGSLWERVFAVDPVDPDHLIAADPTDGLMKVSRTGGATWQPDRLLTQLVTGDNEFRFAVSANDDPARAPGIGVQAHVIAFDPDQPARIVVGTEAAGIMYSLDDGESWSAVPGSRAVTAISSFFFGRGDSVFVSTYGRGLWLMRLPPAAPRHRAPYVVDINTVLSTGWIVDARTNGVISLDQLRDPDYCPICTLALVSGGRMIDLRIENAVIVSGIAIDAGDVHGLTLKGEESPLTVKVDRAEKGGFEGCAACITVLKQGGVIRAVVLEKGMLRAVVAEKESTPGKLPPNELAGSRASLLLLGTVPVTGLATAHRGDTVEVYGAGFCPGGSCPPVSLALGDRAVQKEVKVATDGTFHVSLPVPLEPGGYAVVATQQATGVTRAASAGLVVMGGEGDRGGGKGDKKQ